MLATASFFSGSDLAVRYLLTVNQTQFEGKFTFLISPKSDLIFIRKLVTVKPNLK